MREHLLAVIDTLQSVPDEQFNMEHWWLEDGMAFDNDRNIIYKVTDGPCGCAIGHLIQRGLLSGSVITPSEMPDGSLPYEYTDAIYVQIADALHIYNYKIAEFLFSQYAYLGKKRLIKRDDVIRRIKFIIAEDEIAEDENKSMESI